MRYAIGNMLRAALILFAAISVNAQTDPGWASGQYGYDGAGNIITIGADTFDHDALGRLVRATLKVPPDEQPKTYQIEYDPYGNIVKMPGPDGTVKTFGVDSNTNRASLSDAPANAWATYDEAGRLKKTVGGDEFRYDGLDAVTWSKVDTTTKVHLYTASGERIASVTVAGSTPVRSDWTLRDTSGKVLRRFEKNGSAWSWEEDYIYAGDRLLASEVSDTGQTLHFHLDHLGTPRLITDQHGGRVAEHKYMPFGDEITSPNQDAEKLKFTGHERDGEKLDYMHARYYFPKWGRFLSVDPTWESADLGKPQSWNRYAYVMNNPVNMTDPDGKCPTCIDPKELAMATYATAAEFFVDYVLPDGQSDNSTSADKPDITRPVVAGAVITTQSTDEILTRRTNNESAKRLAERAAAAEADPNIRIHGVSASAKPPAPGETVATKAARSDVEKVFKVHDTPTKKDPLHRTVELPKPVTNRIARIFNRIFKAL